MKLKLFIPQFDIGKHLMNKRDPFNNFKREINKLVDRAFTSYSVPVIGHGDLNIDVCDKGKELEIKIEVPGVSEEDIHVTVQENNLIITGEKKTEIKREETNYYMSERIFGSFMRSIPLPFQVTSDKVEAILDKGVLTIRIHKPKDTSTRSQEIKIKKKQSQAVVTNTISQKTLKFTKAL